MTDTQLSTLMQWWINFNEKPNKNGINKMHKKTILNLMCLLSILISNCAFSFPDSVDTKPDGLILSAIQLKTSNRATATNNFFKKAIFTVKENQNSGTIYNSGYDVTRSKFQLNKDYEFIFFYNNGCQYCKSFAPVLKKYSNNFGIEVRSFVLGERYSTNANSALTHFSNNNVADQGNNMADQEIVKQFFGRASNASVPALFVMNKNNLHAYPVSQGALSYPDLIERMNKLKLRILQHERSIISTKSSKRIDRDKNV